MADVLIFQNGLHCVVIHLFLFQAGPSIVSNVSIIFHELKLLI